MTALAVYGIIFESPKYINLGFHFMNIQGNLDYSRAEVATDARRRPMKLWLSTANGSQRSRCGKIGSPEG